MNTSRRLLLVAATTVAATMFSLPVLAQKDAGSKARGEHSVPFWSSKASQRHFERARNYGSDFRGYLQANPQPAPAVVKEVTSGIGHSLAEAKKHLGQMKKDYSANKDAVAAIEGLEKQLATAVAHHDVLMACCDNATFEVMKTMKCCEDLVDELDKILDGHSKLMEKLAPKHPAPAKK